MLDIGAKIAVISSTVKKSKTGPKKGSIGYVMGKYSVRHVLSGPAPLKIFNLKILFVRYGLEKKARCEIKNVLSAVTASEPNINEKCFTKTMSIDISNQNGTNKLVKKNCFNDGTPMCTIIPYNTCMDIMSYDSTDLLGWTIAHLQHADIINKIVFSNASSHIAINKGILERLLRNNTDRLSSTITNISAMLGLLNNMEKRKLIKTLKLVSNISMKASMVDVKYMVNEDLTCLYQEGASSDEIVKTMCVHLLDYLYSSIYPGMEAFVLKTLYKLMNNLGGKEDIGIYCKLLQTLNNTRNTAMGLNCLFPRPLVS